MWQKVIKSLLIVLLFLMTIVPNAFAETSEGEGSAEETNEKTRQMLDFFRDDRSLDVENTTQDEMKVYGVFLSNFTTPFQTKLGDLDGDVVSKKVSNKFFGNEGQVETVKQINAKIEQAISDGIKNNYKEYSLHYSLNEAKAGKVMTGKQLINIMAGTKEGKKNGKIYNSNGKTVMDVYENGTHGAWKILFGMYPREFVGEERVIRKMQGLYIDGLGNIWGTTDLNKPIEEYILIFPAVLNPVTYTNSLDGGIPLNNVYSMGAMMQINSASVLDNSKMVGYYNLPYLFNKEGMTTIYGVETNNPLFGNLDEFLLKDKGTPYTIKMAKEFANKSMTDDVDEKNTKILITTNFTANKNIIDEDLQGIWDEKGDVPFFNQSDDKKTYTSRQAVASGFVAYMGETISYDLSNNKGKNGVIDTMYFFDTGKSANSEAGASGDYGTWDELDSILPSSLYYYTTDNGEKQFHSNSAYMSKLGKLIYEQGGLSKGEFEKKIRASFKGVSKSTIDGEESDNLGLQVMYKTITGNGTINKSSKVNRWKDSMTYFYQHTYGNFFTDKPMITNEITTNKNFLNLLNSKTSAIGGVAEGDKGYYTTTIELKEQPWKDPNKYANQLVYESSLYRVFTGHSAWASLINSGTKTGSGDKDALGNPMVNRTNIADGVNHYPGMYWAYMVDILNVKSTKDGKMTSSTWSNNYLPKMSIAVNGSVWDINSSLESGGVLSTEEKTLEEQQKDIIRKTTALLSTEFDQVRNDILRSTQNGFLIETHRSIIGSDMGKTFDVSSDSSKTYATTVGYINSPKVSDLPLIDWFIKDYIYVFILMMVLVLIVLVMLTFLRIRTFKQSSLIFITMCFVLYLPQFLVGNTVTITNSFADKLFSERFNYWALVQHEYRLQNSAEEIAGDNELDYIMVSNIQQAEDVYYNAGGVRVKWMSPKKDDVFNDLFSDGRIDENLQSNLTIFKWLFSSYFYEEELSGDRLDTFIYRPYNALANTARTNYTKYQGATKKPSKSDYNSVINTYKVNMTTVPSFRFLLSSDNNRNIKYSQGRKDLINKSSLYMTNLANKEAQTSYRFWGLTDTKVTHAIFRDKYNDTDAGLIEGDSPEYEAFLLNSESPYYYFYNVLKANYTVDGSGFKDSLLREEYFKVTNVDPKVNGATRDFLDMEGLFTYVIPYLHQSNDYVNGWGSKYGLDVPNFDFNAENVEISKNSDTSITQKFNEDKKKKDNLRNVWRLYSPWVAQLYNKENKKNKIKVAGNTKLVNDALNPGAYQEKGRDMIFSEADMYAKAYNVDALSQSEIKMQRVLDETYKDLMYLINYRDLNDEALISMAAMTATFNFNAEFSDYNMFGENSELYPQAFELTNFNYDAFLRLMLLNTTGEPIYIDGGDDLYVRVLEKTSWFTGVILIIKDVTAVYLIPMARIAVLMLLFFLTLIYSFSLILSQPKDIIKKTAKVLGKPILMYMIATSLFSFLMSMFVGDGYDQYVGSQTASFELNDPTITLGFATVLDVVFVYVLFLLIKDIWGTLKKYTGGSITHMAGLVGNTFQQATKGIKNTINNGSELLTGTVKSPVKAYQSNKKRQAYNKERDERIDMMGNLGRIADNTDISSGRMSISEINKMAGSRREDKSVEIASNRSKKMSVNAPTIFKLKSKTKGSKNGTEKSSDYKTTVKKPDHKSPQTVKKSTKRDKKRKS